MKLIKRVMVLLFSIIILVPSISCAQNKTVAPAATPEPTFTATPTVAPTATPSPTPTATPFFSAERTDELNQQIQDFLNKEGDFTPKKISSMMFTIVNIPDENNMTLGLVDGGFKIEGYFFDYVEKDDNIVLLMGFDGKDGNRFIVPMQLPLYFLKNEPKSHFYFIKHNMRTLYDTCIAEITGGNVSNLYVQLNRLKGTCIAFDTVKELYEESEADLTGAALIHFKEHNSKVGLTQKLISLVSNNKISMDYDFTEDDLKNNILMIKNVDDVENAEISSMPLLTVTVYINDD